MKKYFYFLVFWFFIVSCSKENNPEMCIDDICIDGKWEWVESYGSKAGLTITPESTNETRELIITESRYQEFVDNELIVDLEYEFVKSDELSSSTNDSLILKLVTSNWYAVFEENENLILTEPCSDCWTHTYMRK